MLWIKRIDLSVQVICMVGITLCFLFPIVGKGGFENLILGYFIIGGWQVLSMVVHLVFAQRFVPARSRLPYLLLTLSIIIAMCLTPIVPLMFFLFLVMLYVSPILALAYPLICWDELRMCDRALAEPTSGAGDQDWPGGQKSRHFPEDAFTHGHRTRPQPKSDDPDRRTSRLE